MGIAETNKRLKNKNKVVAVIGDGSFTGGLALEAINQIGYLGTPMIIIMNDNRMSIAENVGALSRYTKRIEKTETYKNVKENIEELTQVCSAEGQVQLRPAKRDYEKQACLKNVRALKKAFKQMGMPGMLFEKLGINYIGPVDGHSFVEIEKALKKTERFNGPVLIHARTKKGMGYPLAEEKAEKFHGISPFQLENGEGNGGPKKQSFTDVFGEAMVRLARKDSKIIGITAAMPSGTGLNKLANELPNQFFDVGICEGHASAFAAGMAKNGFRPVIAVYSSFLQRSLDQIIHDICLQNLPVTFAVDRAGIVGEDGPTHHGAFDLSFLRFIPNLVVMAPRDGEELEMMLKFALRTKKPMAIRYPRGSADCRLTTTDIEKRLPITMGKAELIKKGSEQVIVSVGNRADQAWEMAKRKKDCAVWNARFVKPLDRAIVNSIKKADEAIVIEENAKMGGFGSAVLEELTKQNIKTKIRLIGIEDEFVEHGDAHELRKEYLK